MTNPVTQASPITATTLETRGQRAIGVLTLNNPATLNALSFEMLYAITQQLSAWQHDERIIAVWLQGAGDKAFCAGADLRALYKSLTPSEPQNPGDTLRYAQTYFAHEYQLDYTLYHYPKPLIAWLDGIVMGGGIGLANGARWRIATERSTFAMPEISIGLFPDVGASWFLGHIPARIGRFIALTAARLTAADAIFCGLADLLIPAAKRQHVLDTLAALDWPEQSQYHPQAIDDALQPFTHWDLQIQSPISNHLDSLAKLCSAQSCDHFLTHLMHCARKDPWYQPHLQNARSGAPASLYLSWALQDLASTLSLAQTLKTEYNAAIACCLRGDLTEGIRALLIDKDRHPDWLPAASDDKDLTELIEYCLMPHYRGVHPLSHLS